MKVLYNVGHLGNVLLFICHAMKYYPNDEIIFFLEEMWERESDTCSFYRNINERYKGGITPFGKMIFVPVKDAHTEKDEESMKKKLNDIYSSILELNDIDLSQCIIYHNFDEWNWFSVYMNSYYPNIKYNSVIMQKRYGDTLEGDFGATEWMRKNIGEVVADIHEKSGAYTITDNIECIYRVFEVDDDDVYSDFDYLNSTEIFESINPNIWAQIDDFFGLYENDYNRGEPYNLVIIGQWFVSSLNKKGINYFALIQQYLDYLVQDVNVMLKIHPRQKKERMESFFPNIKVIPGYVPSQVLAYSNFIDYSSINVLMTTGGSVFERKNGFYNEFDGWYVNNKSNVYMYINRLYLCMKLAEYLGIKHIRYQGIAVETLPKIVSIWHEFRFCSIEWFNFYKSYDELDNLPLKTMAILGEAGWNEKESPRDDVENCFINAVNSCRDDIPYILIDQNETFDYTKLNSVKGEVYVFSIRKEKRRDNTKCKLNEEKVYLFSSNSSLCERIMNFRVQKNMHNMGIFLYSTEPQRIK